MSNDLDVLREQARRDVETARLLYRGVGKLSIHSCGCWWWRDDGDGSIRFLNWCQWHSDFYHQMVGAWSAMIASLTGGAL